MIVRAAIDTIMTGSKGGKGDAEANAQKDGPEGESRGWSEQSRSEVEGEIANGWRWRKTNTQGILVVRLGLIHAPLFHLHAKCLLGPAAWWASARAR